MVSWMINLVINLVSHDLRVVRQVLSVVSAHECNECLEEIGRPLRKVGADGLSGGFSGQQENQLNIVALRPDTKIRCPVCRAR